MNKDELRVALQQGIYKVINPFVRFLIRAGLTPNMVTTIGLVLNIGVAVIFIIGVEEGNRGDLRYVGWAGFWFCLRVFLICSTDRLPGWGI